MVIISVDGDHEDDICHGLSEVPVLQNGQLLKNDVRQTVTVNDVIYISREPYSRGLKSVDDVTT